MDLKTFALSGGEEALTIYHRPASRLGPERFSVSFPSRSLTAPTPDQLREYSRAWAEAADWLENINRGDT